MFGSAWTAQISKIWPKLFRITKLKTWCCFSTNASVFFPRWNVVLKLWADWVWLDCQHFMIKIALNFQILCDCKNQAFLRNPKILNTCDMKQSLAQICKQFQFFYVSIKRCVKEDDWFTTIKFIDSMAIEFSRTLWKLKDFVASNWTSEMTARKLSLFNYCG